METTEPTFHLGTEAEPHIIVSYLVWHVTVALRSQGRKSCRQPRVWTDDWPCPGRLIEGAPTDGHGVQAPVSQCSSACDKCSLRTIQRIMSVEMHGSGVQSVPKKNRSVRGTSSSDVELLHPFHAPLVLLPVLHAHGAQPGGGIPMPLKSAPGVPLPRGQAPAASGASDAARRSQQDLPWHPPGGGKGACLQILYNKVGGPNRDLVEESRGIAALAYIR